MLCSCGWWLLLIVLCMCNFIVFGFYWHCLTLKLSRLAAKAADHFRTLLWSWHEGLTFACGHSTSDFDFSIFGSLHVWVIGPKLGKPRPFDCSETRRNKTVLPVNSSTNLNININKLFRRLFVKLLHNYICKKIHHKSADLTCQSLQNCSLLFLDICHHRLLGVMFDHSQRSVWSQD